MATWQFSIILIPKLWAEENKFDSSFLYSEEGYDTEIAWEKHQPAPIFKNILSNILPTSKSWNKDLLCWGNEEEHDIQVWYVNNTIDGIHVRLDLNQKLNSIITKLIKTAKELDCVLFLPELKINTEANEFELKKVLQSSQAAKFVKDPYGFLSDL